MSLQLGSQMRAELLLTSLCYGVTKGESPACAVCASLRFLARATATECIQVKPTYPVTGMKKFAR